MQDNENVTQENETRKKSKMTFSDYVYYYKWHAIVIIFALIVVTFGTCQYLNKENPDIYITYTGKHYYNPTNLNEAKSAFAQVMSKDYNGDGQKLVEILNLVYMTDKEWEDARSRAIAESDVLIYPVNNESIKRLSQELLTGESYIFLLSYELYEDNYKLGRFENLETILGYKPENAFDECGIYLKDTDFGKYFDQIKVLPDNTVICFRKAANFSFLNKKKEKEKYNNNVQMLKDILNFKIPE